MKAQATAPVEIANSTARTPPRQATPALACDAHMHILDARFAHQAPVPAGATVAHYRPLQALMGTTRTVVVQARPFGTDNRVVLDAIARLGQEHTRGVAVVQPEVSDAELQQLHEGGIRGIRFSLHTGTHAAVRLDMVEPLAQRVHAWGWHLQLHWTAEQIVQQQALLQRLPTPLVFDHLGRLPVQQGPAHPAFEVIGRLLDQRRAWVKLSGAYLNTLQGPENTEGDAYGDTLAVAQAWVRRAPDRLVWGSDWPHTTEVQHKPDAVQLLDLLARWAGDETTRQQVLVDNPAQLYGFAPR